MRTPLGRGLQNSAIHNCLLAIHKPKPTLGRPKICNCKFLSYFKRFFREVLLVWNTNLSSISAPSVGAAWQKEAAAMTKIAMTSKVTKVFFMIAEYLYVWMRHMYDLGYWCVNCRGLYYVGFWIYGLLLWEAIVRQPKMLRSLAQPQHNCKTPLRKQQACWAGTWDTLTIWALSLSLCKSSEVTKKSYLI